MQPEEIINPTPQSDAPSPANPVATRKILIIEDESFIGDLYERALKNSGYETTVIIDGAEALRQAQTNQFDIILLDIMLPNITGTEIISTLRNRDLTPNLKAKIIITTNLELDDEGRAAIENQADGYLVKADITPKELVHFLDQIDLSKPTPAT